MLPMIILIVLVAAWILARAWDADDAGASGGLPLAGADGGDGADGDGDGGPLGEVLEFLLGLFM